MDWQSYSILCIFQQTQITHHISVLLVSLGWYDLVCTDVKLNFISFQLSFWRSIIGPLDLEEWSQSGWSQGGCLIFSVSVIFLQPYFTPLSMQQAEYTINCSLNRDKDILFCPFLLLCVCSLVSSSLKYTSFRFPFLQCLFHLPPLPWNLLYFSQLKMIFPSLCFSQDFMRSSFLPLWNGMNWAQKSTMVFVVCA